MGARQYLRSSARYVADALWDLTENCQWVILIHEDKHSPCLGVYSGSEFDIAPQIEAFCVQSDILYVPFSIPPMLARWDRALRELRRDWDEAKQGTFPIPVNIDRGEEDDVYPSDSEIESEVEIESEELFESEVHASSEIESEVEIESEELFESEVHASSEIGSEVEVESEERVESEVHASSEIGSEVEVESEVLVESEVTDTSSVSEVSEQPIEE
jgi:hypothetical protein